MSKSKSEVLETARATVSFCRMRVCLSQDIEQFFAPHAQTTSLSPL